MQGNDEKHSRLTSLNHLLACYNNKKVLVLLIPGLLSGAAANCSKCMVSILQEYVSLFYLEMDGCLSGLTLGP